MTRTYSFTYEEAERAYEEWGANCGPNALAFALGLTLDDVRGAIPGFEQRHYTSPSMMKSALAKLGIEIFQVQKPVVEDMFSELMALVRIQWSGPWTQAGANPKWAYRQTHWIAAWNTDQNQPFGEEMVFDCNGGIKGFHDWVDEVVPAIVKSYTRADGGWFPTDIWRIMRP